MKSKQIILTAFFSLMSALVAVGIYEYFGNENHYLTIRESSPAKFAEWNFPVSSSSGAIDFRLAAKIATPAVVHVTTTYQNQNTNYHFDPGKMFGQDFWDYFYGSPGQGMPAQASGSGVLISPDGYIVTNNHVVRDANTVDVITSDNQSYSAEVIGSDPSTDIALIKINVKDFPHLAFGNSDSVEVGQWVLAVGNPFNLSSTVTAGIVSAKARNINILEGRAPIESFIQTDAAVNPGNSGGALVNTNGELIGINTAIATQTGTFEGYSFAVPSNLVMKVIQDLMEFGTVQRAYLGVSIRDMNSDLADQLNLDNTDGVYIDSVFDNSAAFDAGIKHGDVIMSINNKPVNSAPELQEQVGRYRPGDEVSVKLIRNGSEREIVLELKNSAGSTEIVQVEKAQVLDALGIEAKRIDDETKKDLKLDGGIQITRISNGKISDNTDIREGFIITKIDNRPVFEVSDLVNSLSSKKGGIMIEGMYPDKAGIYYYAFGM